MNIPSACLSTVAAIVALATACSGSPGDHADRADERGDIGGFAADSPFFDAVGAMVGSETATPFCTATLVGSTLVATAKHCLLGKHPSEVAFAIGPDGFVPKRVVNVTGFEWERGRVGESMTSMGSDIAVVHLAEEISDITPVRIARPTPEDVGRRFFAVGYGGQSTFLFDPATGELEEAASEVSELPVLGTRRAGQITLHAISGRYWEHFYGSFEVFLDASRRSAPVEDIDQPDFEARVREEFETTVLRARYDAFLGQVGPSEEGDVHICGGDSGGPLLGLVGDELATFGVVSGTRLKTARADLPEPTFDCLDPTIYSTYGPEAEHLIEVANECGGITQQGGCSDGVAIRCTRLEEGPARVVRSDCSALGLRCAATPAEPVCAPACVGDADCEALADGGLCAEDGTCSWGASCTHESYDVACFICCLAGGDPGSCFGQCFGAPEIREPSIALGGTRR